MMTALMLLMILIILVSDLISTESLHKKKKNKKRLTDQARKALFAVMKKSRKLCLPFDIQVHLFDSMIVPILLYGSEVWDGKLDIIDKFQLKFCKMLLGLKMSTPSLLIYDELGITPLHLNIQNRILNSWPRNISGKQGQISVMLHKL